jgi:NADPH:quinone reductase-like Zn-dependent oxidoreductase
MTRRRRILLGVLAILALGISVLAVALSYDAPCQGADAQPSGATLMKAVVYRCYGSPDVLHVEAIPKPQITDNELLVRVHAASINPAEIHFMTGKPYIVRLLTGIGAPKYARLGNDFAGIVESVGRNVKRFRPGDRVFGGSRGALAEYVALSEDQALEIKPDNLSFEQAASIPIAGVTALQGLRDHGRLQPGQHVLINGASGGVGSFAVQIAKAFGAEVTGVTSTRNVELVRSSGADHVIDYTQENFTAGAARYDLILDIVGKHSLSDARRALKPDGILVMVGGSKDNRWIGPLGRNLDALVLALFVDQEFVSFVSNVNRADLSAIADLAHAGKVTPVIDRRYPLLDAAAAMRYLETGRARGKVVLSIE